MCFPDANKHKILQNFQFLLIVGKLIVYYYYTMFLLIIQQAKSS